MKVRLLIAGLFLSLVAAAQPSNYIKFNTRGRWIAGMFDSTLHVPRFNGSPSLRTGGSSMDGAVAIDTTNNIMYFYSGGTWNRANISIPTLQQVLTAGSSIGNSMISSSGTFELTAINELVLLADDGVVLQSGISSIGVRDTTILISPYLAKLYIDTLNYTLSTIGKKILIRDTATGLVQNIDPSLIGSSSYTFTNGLTNSSGTVKLGGTLTEPITVLDGGVTNNLRFQDMLFEVTSSNTLMLGDSISLTGGATPNRLSDIKLKNDTIKINPGIGLLYIDTLTSAVGTKALRYNPTTGLVSYADTSSGGADGYVDNATFNTTTNYLTIEQTGAADVSVRIPPSYIVNPINADSLTRIVNDSTLMVKAVVIADTDPVEVTTVRNDSLNTHTIAIRQTFLDSIRNGDFGGGGITIGTTAITSGTVGRILFEGSGNVVQQSSNLFWNNTDGELDVFGGGNEEGLNLVSTNANYGTHLVFKYNTSTSAAFLKPLYNGGLAIGTDGSGDYIHIGGILGVDGKLKVQGYVYESGGYAAVINTNHATTVGLNVALKVSQTADAINVSSSGGTKLFGVDSSGKILQNTTITAGGTTGNQTIDKPTGTVNIAAAGTTVTVTNNKCTANSIVYAVLRTNDATATGIKSVVPSAGSFVITLNAAATAEVSVGFIVFN